MSAMVARVPPGHRVRDRPHFCVILNRLQAVKDLAGHASDLSTMVQFRCVTLMPYESYINNTSYRGTAGLAEGSLAPDRRTGRADHSPASGKRQIGKRKSTIFAARRKD